MCGIAGLIRKTRRNNSSTILREMASVIAHRGPDDEGFYETTSSNGDFDVGLAHRRLSIIDLSAGHQPIGNEDGTIQIVFNGEIYNFRELRNELISCGHTFATSSDTETIVHAYEEYGEACVERLNGMFAFAIWDSSKEKLFLARDRYGKKPMFLWQQGEELLFASEIKSLLCCPDVQVNVDLNSVWDYLSYRYVPGPDTLIEGISKLPPGSFATWEKGRLQIKSYFTPADMHGWSDAPVPADPVGQFLNHLEEAVSCRMVSDVPFGAFLSGGIDSSAIVGLMSNHSQMPVKTFSVGFNESDYSELKYARVIADQFATEHYELEVSQDHLMEELPSLIRFRDAPVSEPSDIPIYLLSKEARKTVKMVLTGEGSDEFLGGYPKHVFERYASAYQVIPGFMRHGLLEPLINCLPYKFRRAKTAAVNLGLENRDDRMARWFGALSAQERKELVVSQFGGSSHSPGWMEIPSSKRSALRHILSFDQTSWLPDNLLERGDRMTMAASLEARMPFMDHRLAAFASSLPDNFRVRGRTTKWILREAMKRLLPKAILERPKVGFRVPVNEWFRGEMKEYLFDHLTGNASFTRDYYKPDVLNRILSEHMDGRQNHEKLLWSLLNLEIWHQEYLKKS